MALLVATVGVRWGAVAPLFLTSLAIMGSPGPATISLVVAGAAYGVRRSLGYLAGIVAGTAAVLLAVATGVTATLLALPGMRIVLVCFSAAYILRLAYRIALAPPLDVRAGPDRAPSLAGGAAFALANPKAFVAITAAFTSATLSSAAVTDAAAKVVVFALVIVLYMPVWLVAGASLAPLLRDPRRARLINVTLALALVASVGLAVLH